MRLAASAMAVLVVAALLAGNCLSCPIMLLTMTASHGCCPHGKAPKVDCGSQALRHFVKADASTQVGSAVMPAMRTTPEIEAAVHFTNAVQASPGLLLSNRSLPIRI